MNTKKNILVCPLDWGLGHATRMVPVIKAIEENGGNAILAADNRPFEFLKQYFPEKTIIKLSGHTPKYPTNGSMAFAIARSLPEMIRKGKLANKELKKIVSDYNIDAVISDNRYELSLSTIPSVFITHQLNIQTTGWQKIGKPIIDFIQNNYLKKFSEIWIPDIQGDKNLSGKLSKSAKFKNKTYSIGLLSRFSTNTKDKLEDKVDLLIILSGPEPQRTILEKLLLRQALQTKLKTVILQGKPEEIKPEEINNVKLIPHLNDERFSALMQSAKYIISRPGYSTLMDLAVTGCNAIFIPTPGQTEQEYLATNMMENSIAYSHKQNNFELTDAIKNQKEYKGFSIKNDSQLLEKRIINLLNICYNKYSANRS